MASESKSLQELYRDERNKPTAAQSFVTRIARVTRKSEITVRFWRAGYTEPDVLTKKGIAQYLKKPISTLFPKK